MQTILIVEDEKPISDILKFNLEKEGFNIICSFDGKDALGKALGEEVDLILLDVMLPSLDGFQVCRQVREKSSVPIIMLTAKEEEVDKVLGLELGADDYITKPFGMRELIARVKANIRRVDIDSESDSNSSAIKLLDLEIDLEKFNVKKQGKSIDLTLREFELLKFMANNPDKIFSREELLKDVWGYDYYGDIRTVDVTVRRLREKIEDDPSNAKYIQTKRGLGYYFKKSWFYAFFKFKICSDIRNLSLSYNPYFWCSIYQILISIWYWSCWKKGW